MSGVLVVCLISLFLGLQPVTTDLYLPALPSMMQALNASIPLAQLTLSALLLCFGCSQLAWGPVSDKFGRRPVLLIGIALYVLASIASSFSASIEALIFWRALQGAALGAPVMCARAICRDLYLPAEATRVMSRGLSGLGLIAVLCVPLGGLLSSSFGWRFCLAALAIFSACAWLLVALCFKETNTQRNPEAIEPTVLLATWKAILSSPVFWSYATLALCSYCGLFVFLAASSFVYLQVLGQSTTVYAALMVVGSLCYISGTFLGRRLLADRGIQGMVRFGGWITLSSAAAYCLTLVFVPKSAIALAGCQMIFMVGHGIHQPAGQAGSAAPFPQAAGAASAMAGFMMMVGAFLTGIWLGKSMDASVVPMVSGIVFWAMLIVLCAWVLVAKHGGLKEH